MLKDSEVRKNSTKAWLLAARPKTLTGASVPVIIGLAYAWADMAGEGFNLIAAVLCMAFAFVMQIDANFVNDYFDFLGGKDDDERLGPPRACAMGWIDAARMRIGILVTTLLACGVGLPLVLYGGIEMIAVGILCVVFCFLYTTFMSSHAMGDVLVLVFFGVVPVCCTYYLQTGSLSWQVVVASVACGLVVDTLLVVNNYRDIDNDRRTGKSTLIVKVGPACGRLMYLLLGVVACLSGIHLVFMSHPWAFVLPLAYLAIHLRTYAKMVRIGSGRQLNSVLADTARNMFIYAVAVAAGMLL